MVITCDNEHDFRMHFEAQYRTTQEICQPANFWPRFFRAECLLVSRMWKKSTLIFWGKPKDIYMYLYRYTSLNQEVKRPRTSKHTGYIRKTVRKIISYKPELCSSTTLPKDPRVAAGRMWKTFLGPCPEYTLW